MCGLLWVSPQVSVDRAVVAEGSRTLHYTGALRSREALEGLATFYKFSLQCAPPEPLTLIPTLHSNRRNGCIQ
eukprot:5930299-Prymnesium_polylepis.1